MKELSYMGVPEICASSKEPHLSLSSASTLTSTLSASGLAGLIPSRSLSRPHLSLQEDHDPPLGFYSLYGYTHHVF